MFKYFLQPTEFLKKDLLHLKLFFKQSEVSTDTFQLQHATGSKYY